ncbi:MAG: DUF1080 domain-containing protein [Chloroflexi bacterium]|nr:DUF1080 domain-containing protein [Chloroflexota bacterium]
MKHRTLAVGALVVVSACSPAGAVPGAETTEKSMTHEEQQLAWMPLFDGRSLEGWAPRGAAEWKVENGEIVAAENSGRGHLATVKSYGNFVLRVEFWVDSVANSGVFIRTPEAGELNQSNSFEVNIFDAHAEWPTGSINEIQRTSQAPVTAGRWNTFEISALGDNLKVTLNDQPAVDARASRLAAGSIGLQYNGRGVIRFRNLRLLPLSSVPASLYDPT